MPCPVRCTKYSARPGLGEHVAGGGVDLLGGHARANRVQRRRAGPAAAPNTVRPHRDSARRGCTCGCESELYPGSYRAADIDDDDVTGLQFAIRILVMRVCAVRSGADDDERHLRMPFGDNGFGDVGGDVGLGAAGIRNSGTRACTRSMAAPALRSASISPCSLTIRSPRSTSVASTGSTPSTSASGSRCSAGMESVTADRRRERRPARRATNR